MELNFYGTASRPRAQGSRISASQLLYAHIVEAKTFKSHMCFRLDR